MAEASENGSCGLPQIISSCECSILPEKHKKSRLPQSILMITGNVTFATPLKDPRSMHYFNKSIIWSGREEGGEGGRGSRGRGKEGKGGKGKGKGNGGGGGKGRGEGEGRE